MMANLFIEAFQIIKRNKSFVFAVFIWWLLSYFETIPDTASWPSLLIKLIRLILVLFLNIYAVAIVLVEKGLLENVESPAKLTYKFIGKGLIVTLVSTFWIFLILAIPYFVVNYFENSSSGLIKQVLGAVKSFAVGFLIFGTFTSGMAILISRKTPILESPALGLMEMYKNFSYYFKSLFIVAIVGQLPTILLVALILIVNIDEKTAFEQVSHFPNNIAYISTPILLLMMIYQLADFVVNIFQRIAIILVYTNRPKSTEERQFAQAIANPKSSIVNRKC